MGQMLLPSERGKPIWCCERNANRMPLIVNGPHLATSFSRDMTDSRLAQPRVVGRPPDRTTGWTEGLRQTCVCRFLGNRLPKTWACSLEKPHQSRGCGHGSGSGDSAFDLRLTLRPVRGRQAETSAQRVVCDVASLG